MWREFLNSIIQVKQFWSVLLCWKGIPMSVLTRWLPNLFRRPVVVADDDEFGSALLPVLLELGSRIFGCEVLILELVHDEIGAVERFKIRFDATAAARLLSEHKRGRVEKEWTDLLNPDSGQLRFVWDLLAYECTVFTVVFPARADNPGGILDLGLREQRRIAWGVDELGATVSWPVNEEAHALVMKRQTGAGTTVLARTIAVNAALAGFEVVVADFDFTDEWDGLLEWPNVSLVGRDLHSSLRAIEYVGQELKRRNEVGGPHTPLLLVVHQVDKIVQLLRGREDLIGSRDVPSVCATLMRLMLLGRVPDVHVLCTSDGRPPSFVIPNSGHCIQVGPMDQWGSHVLWNGYAEGWKIPRSTRGRAMVRTDDGFRTAQAYFTPDPRRDAERFGDLIGSLRPASSLYERLVFDLPDADKITSWEQLAATPVVQAADRPDLDPLSPAYRPRKVEPNYLKRDGLL